MKDGLQGLKAKMADRDDRQINRMRNPKTGHGSANGLRFRVPADPTPRRERMARVVMPCTLRPRRRQRG